MDMEGKGKYTYKNGDVYEGRVKAGKITGKGRKTTKSGIYEGEFKDGAFEGIGRFTGNDGSLRYGMWHAGKFAKPLQMPENGEEIEDSDEEIEKLLDSED